MKKRFCILFVHCGWDWIPVRTSDDYLNGYFIGWWFVGFTVKAYR